MKYVWFEFVIVAAAAAAAAVVAAHTVCHSSPHHFQIFRSVLSDDFSAKSFRVQFAMASCALRVRGKRCKTYAWQVLRMWFARIQESSICVARGKWAELNETKAVQFYIYSSFEFRLYVLAFNFSSSLLLLIVARAFTHSNFRVMEKLSHTHGRGCCFLCINFEKSEEPECLFSSCQSFSDQRPFGGYSLRLCSIATTDYIRHRIPTYSNERKFVPRIIFMIIHFLAWQPSVRCTFRRPTCFALIYE